MLAVFPALDQLLMLSQKPRLSDDELGIAKISMRELRELGFTNRDVSIMTGERWEESTVKKYTRGVKTVSTAVRDKALRLITEFSRANKTLEDLEEYEQVRGFLDEQGVKIYSLFKFYKDMLSKKFKISELVKLHDELGSSERDVHKLNSDLDREEYLVTHSLTMTNMEVIHQTAEKYGGFEKTMEALEAYKDLGQLNNQCTHITRRISDLELKERELHNRKQEKETDIKILGAYADTGKRLLEMGYDLPSLMALKNLANTYGGPVQLSEAIAEYEGVKELKQRKEDLKQTCLQLDAEKTNKTSELASLEHFISEANKKIGAIEANQAKAVAAQNVYTLMTEPENLHIDPGRFKRTVLHFLLGVKQYGDMNKDAIDGWKNVESLLKYTIEALTKIL